MGLHVYVTVVVFEMVLVLLLVVLVVMGVVLAVVRVCAISRIVSILGCQWQE